MNKKNGRDYNVDFKTREEGDKKYIEGYFAVYNSRYNLWGDYYETIAPGAFDKTLAVGRDVVSLWNHDSNYPLGRKSKGTLRLVADNVGLFGTVEINPEDSFAVDVYARIKRGDVHQCSFGCDIIKDTTIRHDDGTTEFRLEEIGLWEISPCTFPAYTETTVQTRKKDAGTRLDNRKKIFAERMKKLAKNLKAKETA